MSDESYVVDDLVVLGNAVPDIISDQRITVCTVGFSSHLGLVRIYPVPPSSHMMRWNVVQIPLDRNPKDARPESWKIQGSKTEWDKLSSKIELKRKLKDDEKRQLVEKLHSIFGAGCIEDLNDKRVSLGMIKPKIIGYRLEKRDDYEGMAQTQLGKGYPFLTIKNYPLKPVIEYRCPNCKIKGTHNQQVVEWGVFEWMRQNPKTPEKVWENLRLTDSSYERSFLVGNMVLYPTSFMIISLFRFKSDAN